MQWIVTLTPDVAPEPLIAVGAPPSGAALVEVRLDLFPGLDLESVVRACPLPILATVRSTAEGGRGPVGNQERTSLLSAARDSGAALIDIEWQRDREVVRTLGLAPEQVIASWHDPSGTPINLEEIVTGMVAEFSAGWVKAVPTAHTLSDLERVLALHLSPRISREVDRRRLLAFAMGPAGVASRYLAPLLGAPMGFAAWCDSAAAAPGQIAIDRLEAAVGHLTAPPRTLFGVIGSDVSASLSPTLHGAAFRATHRPECLIPINVADRDELAGLFTAQGQTVFDRLGLNVGGWAVTTPYKQAAASAATTAAPRVRRAGAANTLILRPGGLIAENTDADGVVGALTALEVDVLGAVVVVQGAGGAARGAAVGLDLAGASVFLRSRDDDRAREVAGEIGVQWIAAEDRAGAEILVNATPLGRQEDDPLPFSESEITMAGAVVDMVYGTQTTALVTLASESGLAVVDGKAMLAFQGIAQHAAFTSAVPPREAMLKSLGLQSLFCQKT